MNEKYAALIKAELDEANSTTSDFRSRSLTIVTTSGGLVTLLSGLIAVASGGGGKSVIPGGAHGPLVVALGLYVVAAVLALSIHIPRDVQRATPEGLEQLLGSDDKDADATRKIAELQLTTTKSLRSLNASLAWFLLVAVAFEILAIGATGLTAARVIESSSGVNQPAHSCASAADQNRNRSAFEPGRPVRPRGPKPGVRRGGARSPRRPAPASPLRTGDGCP